MGDFFNIGRLSPDVIKYKNFGEQPSMFQIQIGYSLVPLVTKETNSHRTITLLDGIHRLRNKIDGEYGLIIPSINIRDNMCLQPDEYAIVFNEVEQGKGIAPAGYFYCFDKGDVIPNAVDTKKYHKVKDPCFGMEGLLVPKEDRRLFVESGYASVPPESIILTHLEKIIIKNRTKILDQCMVYQLVEKVRIANPDVYTYVLFNCQFTVSDLKILLNSLLEEHISIRDMNTIMETIADYLPEVKSPLRLAEKVRARLAYSLMEKYADEDYVLHVVKLSESMNILISENYYYPESEIEPPDISLEPEIRKEVVAKIAESIKPITDKGWTAVILCLSTLRLPLANFIHRTMPEVPVISDKEIMALNGDYEIKLEGEVTIGTE